MPTLLITMGATGSGKSKLAEEIIKKLKIKDPIFFRIDDYVQNDKYYKNKIKNFTKRKNFRNKLKNPNKKTLKYFEKHYFNSRDIVGCKGDKKTKKKKKIKECINTKGEQGCSLAHDTDMNKALRNKKNIVYETNGKSFPSWLIESIKKCSNYKIIIGAVKVSVNNLILRNKTRALKDMETFLKNNKEAPRLPDISKKTLSKNTKLLNKTIKNIFLYKCLQKDYIEKECGQKLNRLLIYDNNKNLKLIYDSKQS